MPLSRALKLSETQFLQLENWGDDFYPAGSRTAGLLRGENETINVNVVCEQQRPIQN